MTFKKRCCIIFQDSNVIKPGMFYLTAAKAEEDVKYGVLWMCFSSINLQYIVLRLLSNVYD